MTGAVAGRTVTVSIGSGFDGAASDCAVDVCAVFVRAGFVGAGFVAVGSTVEVPVAADPVGVVVFPAA